MTTFISNEVEEFRPLSRLGTKKSHIPLNLTNRQTHGRTDLSIYRVASLLKIFKECKLILNFLNFLYFFLLSTAYFKKLFLYLHRCHRLTHGTFSSFGHISVVVDWFEHFLRFCYLGFVKEAISGGFMAHYRVLSWDLEL